MPTDIDPRATSELTSNSRPQALDLKRLGEGDVAYLRARRQDDDVEGDWPVLVFTASGALWAGAESKDQAIGFILQNDMTAIELS